MQAILGVWSIQELAFSIIVVAFRIIININYIPYYFQDKM